MDFMRLLSQPVRRGVASSAEGSRVPYTAFPAACPDAHAHWKL